jgi:HK97 family phage prohead protease
MHEEGGFAMKRKELPVEIEESSAVGGRIRISTGALDRQKDRVIPSGAMIENYMKNPVVQWGHNYRDPWATIGETVQLEVSNEGIVAEFALREPANESDPMHIIRALWTQGLIRTASIGFNPEAWDKNDEGGLDFTSWELLEWSLVPVPANQEALRLAVKSLDQQEPDGAPDDHASPVPERTDADIKLGPELRKALTAFMQAFSTNYGGNSNV